MRLSVFILLMSILNIVFSSENYSLLNQPFLNPAESMVEMNQYHVEVRGSGLVSSNDEVIPIMEMEENNSSRQNSEDSSNHSAPAPELVVRLNEERIPLNTFLCHLYEAALCSTLQRQISLIVRLPELEISPIFNRKVSGFIKIPDDIECFREVYSLKDKRNFYFKLKHFFRYPFIYLYVKYVQIIHLLGKPFFVFFQTIKHEVEIRFEIDTNSFLLSLLLQAPLSLLILLGFQLLMTPFDILSNVLIYYLLDDVEYLFFNILPSCFATLFVFFIPEIQLIFSNQLPHQVRIIGNDFLNLTQGLLNSLEKKSDEPNMHFLPYILQKTRFPGWKSELYMCAQVFMYGSIALSFKAVIYDAFFRIDVLGEENETMFDWHLVINIFSWLYFVIQNPRDFTILGVFFMFFKIFSIA